MSKIIGLFWIYNGFVEGNCIIGSSIGMGGGYFQLHCSYKLTVPGMYVIYQLNLKFGRKIIKRKVNSDEKELKEK